MMVLCIYSFTSSFEITEKEFNRVRFGKIRNVKKENNVVLYCPRF